MNAALNYSPRTDIRALLTDIAERFTPSGSARSEIVERSLLIIMDKPELDLSDPVRELLPVVREVALEHLDLPYR